MAVSGKDSPPLARGALSPCLRMMSVMGLTPARAGSTQPPTAPGRRRWTHPRSRGEHGTHACTPSV